MECGVPTFINGDPADDILRIDEKPTMPASSYAVVGLYVFSPDVFDKIIFVEKSPRGEAEVTELLNMYADRGVLDHTILDGFWGDAGTVLGMAECNAALATIAANTRDDV